MCIHVFVMGYMPHDKRIDDDMIHLQKKKAYEWISSLLQCALYNIAVTSMQVCQLIYFLLAMLFPQWCTFLGWMWSLWNKKLTKMKQTVDMGGLDACFQISTVILLSYRDSWTFSQMKINSVFLFSFLTFEYFNISILITLWI